jgi:hypothetical protein
MPFFPEPPPPPTPDTPHPQLTYNYGVDSYDIGEVGFLA